MWNPNSGLQPPYFQVCPPYPSVGPNAVPGSMPGYPGSAPYPPNVHPGGAPGQSGLPSYGYYGHGHHGHYGHGYHAGQMPPYAPGMNPGPPICLSPQPGYSSPPGGRSGPQPQKYSKHGPGHHCYKHRRHPCSSDSDSD